MMKVTLTLRKFANVPKNSIGLSYAVKQKKNQQEGKLPNNYACHSRQRTKLPEIFWNSKVINAKF